jgi:phospholipase/carboxylesterase
MQPSRRDAARPQCAGPENILDLVPRLVRPQCSIVAPAAPNRTWYPYSFMADVEKNEPILSNALAHVRQWSRAEQRRAARAGSCCLASRRARACDGIHDPQRLAFGGLIAFSGGAIGPPGTEWTQSGDFDGTPMFFGCSDVDAHVPRARARERECAADGRER